MLECDPTLSIRPTAQPRRAGSDALATRLTLLKAPRDSEVRPRARFVKTYPGTGGSTVQEGGEAEAEEVRGTHGS